MVVFMDMGTTNTRLWLADEKSGHDIASLRGNFGAGTSLGEGRESLLCRTRELIGDLLRVGNVSAEDVGFLVASGMASSDVGLLEVPHIAAPAGLRELAAGIVKTRIPGIFDGEIRIVPGVRKNNGDGKIADMMRGEETETVGIADLCGAEEGAVLVLPGSHNKAILLGKDRKITDFATSMSGELLSAVAGHTILSKDVGFDFSLDGKALEAGCRMAEEAGLGAALFRVRVLARNGAGRDEVSSFFFGAVLSQDVKTIRTLGGGNIYVGGRSNLRAALCRLLGNGCREIPEEISARAVRHGLSLIASEA